MMPSPLRVPFREIMHPNSRPVTLGDDQDANLVGMRWYGEGPFHRELKPAMQIAKKSHFLIKAGDVVYNKLFAWKGAFGLVPSELDGMYVSDKFPTYKLDETRVSDRYLAWYFRHHDVWEQARHKSTGSAALSKFTLNPPMFLDLDIPLPSLDDQVRLVRHIDILASKIEEVSEQKRRSQEKSGMLFMSACDRILQEELQRAVSQPLASLVDPERGISYGIVQTGSEYPDGVPTLRAGDLRWFDVNTVDVKKVDPLLAANFKRTALHGGELLLRIRGGVGEVAICPSSMKGGNVSREIAVIPLVRTLLPDYAMFMLAAPTSQRRMRGLVRGTSYVGINLKDVRELEIPVPSVQRQEQVVGRLKNAQEKIKAFTSYQERTSRDIDKLLPAVLNKVFGRRNRHADGERLAEESK